MPQNKLVMALDPWPYDNFQKLQADYPGITDADGPFARTVLKKDSPLGIALHNLRHSSALPAFPLNQLLTAVLLGFEKRYGTRAEITKAIFGMPAFAPSLESFDKYSPMAMKYDKDFRSDPLNVAAKVVKSVLGLLQEERTKYFCDFPLKESVPPTDPAKFSMWQDDFYREIDAETKDPVGMPPPYNYDYGGNNWMMDFDRETYLHPEACGPHDRNYYIKPLKECCMFDNYIDGWVAEGSRTFHDWSRLPLELKAIVIEHAFTFKENLDVDFQSLRRSPSSIGVAMRGYTHEENLTIWSFRFDVSIETPLAHVSSDDKIYHRHLGGTRNVICNPRSVSQEFRDQFTQIFYGKNAFKFEDRGKVCVGTHRWLELMQKRGYLGLIRKLNIKIEIEEHGQTKWYIRRFAWSALAMGRLQRLVLNVDMRSFNDRSYFRYDPDYYSPHQNVSKIPEQLPGMRMLLWADPKFTVFIPQYRTMEGWLNRQMALPDTDQSKFWVDSDWFDPSGTFPNPTIAAAVAVIRSRQLPGQQLVRTRFIPL